MGDRKIERGIAAFDGVFQTWYGWAQRKLEPDQCTHCGGQNGGHMRWCSADGPLYDSRRFEFSGYREGKNRLLKVQARLDALRLARKLA